MLVTKRIFYLSYFFLSSKFSIPLSLLARMLDVRREMEIVLSVKPCPFILRYKQEMFIKRLQHPVFKLYIKWFAVVLSYCDTGRSFPIV